MRIIVFLTLIALVFACVCYTNAASLIRPNDFDVELQLQQEEGLLEETLTAIETGRQPRTIGALVLLDFLLSRILNAIIEQNNQNGAPDDNQDQVVV
uniref:Putative salivary secreted protein n=1 Tax=Glossina morsitans morsitans TaxID=37546 RepID=D3TMI4_GLOMM